MAKIEVLPGLTIDEREIREVFVHASGPGGQNVNKVATAVELRFDARNSPSLSDEVRARLKDVAGRRLTKDGVLIITAERYRTQARNREDARAKVVDLLQRAARPIRARRPTRPPASAAARRLQAKHRRAQIKNTRKDTYPVD